MLSSLGGPFSDGSWYRSSLLNHQASLDVSNKPDQDELSSLTDNSLKRFVDRYFDAFYLPDVGGESFNDICVLRHSNRVCALGLAPAHHLFSGFCRAPNEATNRSDYPPHKLLGVEFKISDKVNRLNNVVSGRRKHGGQIIGRAPHVLAFAICDRMVKHPLICGVPGRLFEVNARLTYPPAPPTVESPVPLTPKALGPFGCSSDNGSAEVGPYLCIILPSFRSHQMRSPKRQRPAPSDSHTASPGQEDADHSDLDDDTDADADYTGMNASNVQQVVSDLRRISGERVLTWKQYSALRNL